MSSCKVAVSLPDKSILYGAISTETAFAIGIYSDLDRSVVFKRKFEGYSWHEEVPFETKDLRDAGTLSTLHYIKKAAQFCREVATQLYDGLWKSNLAHDWCISDASYAKSLRVLMSTTCVTFKGLLDAAYVKAELVTYGPYRQLPCAVQVKVPGLHDGVCLVVSPVTFLSESVPKWSMATKMFYYSDIAHGIAPHESDSLSGLLKNLHIGKDATVESDTEGAIEEEQILQLPNWILRSEVGGHADIWETSLLHNAILGNYSVQVTWVDSHNEGSVALYRDSLFICVIPSYTWKYADREEFMGLAWKAAMDCLYAAMQTMKENLEKLYEQKS